MASNRRRRLLASVGIRAETYKPVHLNRPPTALPLRRHAYDGLYLFKTITLPPAFLISHGTAYGGTMTARNCGVIAPGNHWILDSLRGAPPPGEAMGAAAPEGCPYIVEKSFLVNHPTHQPPSSLDVCKYALAFSTKHPNCTCVFIRSSPVKPQFS